ncbi:MAG: hypothetical protein QM501_13065 [Gimesia sp.]
MKTVLRSSRLIIILCLISALGPHTFAQEKSEKSTTFSEQQKKIKAIELAKRGQEFLRQKKWKEAVSKFEQAVKLQPESSILHHLLGVSYLENSQASPGWIEFRKAVLLDLTNKRAINDFMNIWNIFDRKGILNVGTTEVEFLNVLGKPDRKRVHNGETQLGYGFMWVNFRKGRLYALVDTRGLTVELTKALNTMEFQLPPHWREGYRMINASNALTEYVKGEDTVQKYQQVFTTQRLLKRGEQLSAREMMNRTKSALEKTHQLESWNVLHDSEDDVLFEWRTKKNAKASAHHEITRVIKGKQDMHRLAYLTTKLPLSDESRAEWIKLLQSAKLVVAHPKKTKLTTKQKKTLADQLTKKSREIISLQLQYIQNLDVKSMQPYFTKRLRARITTDSLEKAKQLATTATAEELVHSIQIEESGDQIQAKIKMKNGRTLTTLIPVNGKWEADTIWFK